MEHVYGINKVEDLWNEETSEGIKVEFQAADGSVVEFDSLNLQEIDEHNDPSQPGT